MSNHYFKFKKFCIYQDKCAMKVTTMACIQGAWLPPCRPRRILDIGSGTGLLTLMAAQQFDCPIDAVEIDAGAYDQLNANIASSPWADRITAFHEDIVVFDARQGERYDLIITNPPFFTNHLHSPDARINLARHQVRLTLASLVNAIDHLLTDTGNVSILLPPDQTERLIFLCRQHTLYMTRQLFVADREQQKPKAIISVFARQKSEVIKKTLVVKSDDRTYTSDFKALLKDYYLNL